ncbi:MAG: VRR-NUC domain-containing protein, partial [Bacteroidota bacterium]
REIDNIGLALEELRRNKFISFGNEEGVASFVFLFTKPEIISLSEAYGWDAFFKKSQRKEDIIFSIIEQVSTTEVFEVLFDEDRIIFFESSPLVNFFKLLFFGDQYSDMTQFVMRDLGNVKLENFDNVDFTPNFHSREEVVEYITYIETYQTYKEAKDLLTPLKCYQWFTDAEVSPPSDFGTKSGKLYSKIVLKLGKLLEQGGFTIEALDIYRKTSQSPSRERQVRLLTRLNELEEATTIAKSIIEQPKTATEALFAKDYLNQNTGRIKRSTTLSLKAADEITLIQDPALSVERQAVRYFQEQGFEAFHTENSLWRFLFGTIFWTETYDTSQSTFHHPLQRLPSDMQDKSFYDKRADAINEKLKKLRSKKSLLRTMEDVYANKYGIANPYVYWSDDLLTLSMKAVELMPLKGLKEVLKMIAIQVKTNSTGFPDLFVFQNRNYHFYEIKSPTDQLSAQQLFWIDFMHKWNIRADVLKVNWER